MDDVLKAYIPEAALLPCRDILRDYKVQLEVVKRRVTRHGDYQMLPGGAHRIRLNATENPYRFLITFLHELAHMVAFEKYGRQIKPHGREWKNTFKDLMLPFIRPEIFPTEMLPVLARHFKNPKASSSIDQNLSIALKEYDLPNGKIYVEDIPTGSPFRLYNGKIFLKGDRRVKRIECKELSTGRIYLFQPHAEVEWIKNTAI